MAQFDVHRLGETLVINCQADLLASLESRFVVPLVPISEAPKAAQRLNPIFHVAGAEFLMLTQAAAAVERRELGAVVASLADRSFEVTGALDVLISGV
jgi:toxin CcdB